MTSRRAPRLNGERRGAEPVVRAPAAACGSADAMLAVAAAVGTLVVYIRTLCPTIYVEDAAEFSTAAAVLGVPHPPGYPFYTLLAAAFVRLVPIGDAAYRSNLFSAVCGAGAVGALCLTLRRLGASRAAALAAAFCFAFGATFWSQCLAAEVHALNALLIVFALAASLEAARRRTVPSFAVAALFFGLAIGHRNLNLLLLAPLGVVLVRASRRAPIRGRLLAAAAGALAASALVVLYLPLAASRQPPLDMGHPVTLVRFLEVVSARAFLRHLGSASLAVDARRCFRFAIGLPASLGAALLAAPLGFLLWYRRRQLALLAVVAWLVLACWTFATFYNVPDVESYLVPAHLGLALAAGVGFDAWRGKGRLLLPLMAGLELVTTWPKVDLRHTTITRDYARQLIEGAPPRALVVSFGDTETHVLAYEQAVEHRRPDVVVASASEVDGWYIAELVRRHPEVAWPRVGADDWLAALVRGNRNARPVCSTVPVLDGDGWRSVPTGLLFCLTLRLDAAALARNVDFWRVAVTPSPAELEHPEFHVRMIDFAFALSRFSLASALAEVGDAPEARRQLQAVVAARPDASERAVAAAMQGIGRARRTGLDLGRRAEAALELGPGDLRWAALLRL